MLDIIYDLIVSWAGMINWQSVVTASTAFAVVLCFKVLLDLKYGSFLVWNFHWVPLRSIFREKPPQIQGEWIVKWAAAGTERYKDVELVHESKVRQVGSYCVSRLLIDGTPFETFGRIEGRQYLGEWYMKEDNLAYIGVFQFEIINSDRMIGKWLGHSESIRDIRMDAIELTRVKKPNWIFRTCNRFKNLFGK